MGVGRKGRRRVSRALGRRANALLPFICPPGTFSFRGLEFVNRGFEHVSPTLELFTAPLPLSPSLCPSLCTTRKVYGGTPKGDKVRRSSRGSLRNRYLLIPSCHAQTRRARGSGPGRDVRVRKLMPSVTILTIPAGSPEFIPPPP